MEIPPENIEVKRKIAIIDEYHALCQNLVPYLRILINSRMPGNPESIFEQFKIHFDALFMLTCDKKGLNKDIIAPVKTWLDTQHRPVEKDMRDGLILFDNYKGELFRMNVL